MHHDFAKIAFASGGDFKFAHAASVRGNADMFNVRMQAGEASATFQFGDVREQHTGNMMIAPAILISAWPTLPSGIGMRYNSVAPNAVL